MKMNVLNQTPEFSTKGILRIQALSPLSMVTQMPGKYYRSQSEPSREMLYGMLENALGWHLSEKDRQSVFQSLLKRHSSTQTVISGSGFRSVLQFHVRINGGVQTMAGTMSR